VDLDRDHALLLGASEQPGHLEAGDTEGIGDFDPGSILEIVRPGHRRHQCALVFQALRHFAHLSAEITKL